MKQLGSRKEKKIGRQPVMRGKGAGSWKLLLNAFWSKTSAWHGQLPWQRWTAKDMCWWMTVEPVALDRFYAWKNRRREREKKRESRGIMLLCSSISVDNDMMLVILCITTHPHTVPLSQTAMVPQGRWGERWGRLSWLKLDSLRCEPFLFTSC